MALVDWKDIAVVLLTILAYFLRDKLNYLKDKIKELEETQKKENDNFQKFKSQYYVKMEAYKIDSTEKFAKVHEDISNSKADILEKMNADKIEVLQKISELNLQIKSGSK